MGVRGVHYGSLRLSFRYHSLWKEFAGFWGDWKLCLGDGSLNWAIGPIPEDGFGFDHGHISVVLVVEILRERCCSWAGQG